MPSRKKKRGDLGAITTVWHGSIRLINAPHEYAIAIAEEAAKAGFDEINFDYIRFPAREGLVYSKESTPQNRIQAIEEFLDKAQKRLRKYGVFISVDTYGNICWAEGEDDNNIGQTVRSMASKADYLAPMLYPSGFANGSFGGQIPPPRSPIR